jgi:riboflavin synthase
MVYDLVAVAELLELVVVEDEDEDEDELQAAVTKARSSTPHAPAAFRVRLFI